jgi:hypothetical protein
MYLTFVVLIQNSFLLAVWLSKHVFHFQLVKFLPLHLLNYYTLTFGVVIAHLPLMGHVIFLLLLMTTPDVHGLDLMQHKSEARSLLQSFINLVENQFSTTIKIIRSNNGSKFTIPSFYSDKEIIHQTSCVSTPQQNEVVERKYRHLFNMS